MPADQQVLKGHQITLISEVIGIGGCSLNSTRTNFGIRHALDKSTGRRLTGSGTDDRRSD